MDVQKTSQKRLAVTIWIGKQDLTLTTCLYRSTSCCEIFIRSVKKAKKKKKYQNKIKLQNIDYNDIYYDVQINNPL